MKDKLLAFVNKLKESIDKTYKDSMKSEFIEIMHWLADNNLIAEYGMLACCIEKIKEISDYIEKRKWDFERI
jgi:hypothetical protein